MRITLSKLDPDLQKLLKKISRIAEREDLSVFMVGGIVRDTLLGRNNLDLDIIVQGDHLRLIKTLEQELKTKAVIHSQFLTARMNYKNIRIDVACVRKEHYPKPGSLPVVEPGMLRDDLYRRDFTINALAMDLNKEGMGEIIDFFGGLGDLKKRQIRILHQKSFEDDPTRILRAVRFAGRFNFDIEEATLKLLRKALKDDYPSSITPNRYWTEFRKILSEADPLPALELARTLRVFNFIDDRFLFPQTELRKVKALLAKIRIECDKGLVYWLVLIRYLPSQKIFPAVQKFPFKKLEKKAMLEVQKFRNLHKSLVKAKKRSEVYGLLKPFVCELVLAEAVGRSILNKAMLFLNKDSHVKLDITGEDLKARGIKEGEVLGGIMNELLMKKIDGKLKNKKSEWQMARQLALR